MSAVSGRREATVGASVAVCGAMAAWLSLVAKMTGHGSQLGSLRTTAILAIIVVIPAVLFYGRRRHGWLNPLALPAAYLAIVVVAPITYVQATGTSLGLLVPGLVTPELVFVFGLLFVGYVAGAAAGIGLTPADTKERGAVDYLRVRRLGRALLSAALASEVGVFFLTRGLAYGANQVDKGLKAQLAAFGAIAVVTAMTLIVLSNVSLARRSMFTVDWILFGSFALAVFTIGGRSAVVPGLVLITWGWLSQRKVPWTRIAILTALVAVLFAGLISARKGGSVVPSSGQQTEQALLRSVSSPAYLTGVVARDVPTTQAYSHGSTYVQALYFQLPGAIARRVFGPQRTGAYAFRHLTNFNNPNEGFGFALPAEAYLNFGPVGVPIAGAVVGLLFGWAWRRRNDTPKAAQHALYLVLVCTFPLAIRSDALGSIKLVLYPMVALWLAFKACRVRQPGPFAALRPARGAAAASANRIGVLKPASGAQFRRRGDGLDRGGRTPILTRAALVTPGARPFRPSLVLPPTPSRPAPGAGWPADHLSPSFVDPVTSLGRSANRAVAFLADESLSSIQNFVMVFAALHYLSISNLGRFTIAYTFALLIESTLRSLLLLPLSIRFSHADAAVRRAAAKKAAGAAAGIGSTLAVIGVLGFIALPGESGAILLGAGIALPCLILQEAWRMIFFTEGRPWRAAINDGLTLVCTIGLLVPILAHTIHPSAAVLLALWAVGTGCGALFGAVQLRMLPSIRATRSWIAEQWSLGSRLAGAQSAERVAAQIAFVMIAAIATSHALGQLSAARTLVAPFTTLVAATTAFAVPEAARLYQRRSPQLKWFAPGLSLALGAGITAFGLVLFTISDGLGHRLAGPNWSLAKELLIPILIWTGANALRVGPIVGLQVMERSKVVLRLSIGTGLSTLLAVSIGAAIYGAHGAAWAFASAAGVAAAVYWVVFLRLSRTSNPVDQPRSDDDPSSLGRIDTAFDAGIQ